MIDRTDLEIIEELKEDGRASFSDIAEKLDLATSTVTARFQKLEKKGIITGFRPVIDYEELGFELTSMIGIKARSEKTKEVADKIKSNKKVISFFEVTGETDMILITRFLDREDMNSFIKSLQKIDGIKSTETNVILTEPKLEDNMSLEALEKSRN
jgi:DNA-binding Lrp family transcriptional regulator